MAITATAPESLALPVGEGLTHLVCCRDHIRSLCDIDVSAHGWYTGEPACAPCELIDRDMGGCCPFGGGECP